jgi:hypothetical protein
MFWGRSNSDYAQYSFRLEKELPAARIDLRVAFPGPAPRLLKILLDGEVRKIATLQPTGGFGDSPDQWLTCEIPLGKISAGSHQLIFKPGANENIINIDWWGFKDR